MSDSNDSHPQAIATKPRGFLLVVVAAMATIAAVVAMSQWQVALSSARTGTMMGANIKARAIADACLEKWLRYAKDGVDTGSWVDFDRLLDPSANTAANDEDFIPDNQATDCTAGVTYVPKSMAAAAGLQRGLHRYCGIRMDGGVCLMRFDDNSDDGKAGGVLSGEVAPDAIEGTNAASGDNPRRDRDFSVLVTAIGLYPAKASTPVDDLYHRAEARSTKRALLQIEIQASNNGWPSIHSNGTVTLVNGPGSNTSVKACGTGGIAAPTVNPSSGGQTDDGCVCGYQKVGASNPLQSSCTGCGAEGCATGDTTTLYNVATDAIDDDTCRDGAGTFPACGAGDNEFDPDTPPPVFARPLFLQNNSLAFNPTTNWRIAAPGMAFSRSIAGQTSFTTNVPRWITGNLPDPSPQPGDPTNPICTYFLGGTTTNKGRTTIEPQSGSADIQHIPVTGTPHLGSDNISPRAAYIWDHSDVDVHDTLTVGWAAGFALGPAAPAPVSAPSPTWAPFVAPDPVQWPPVSPINCKAWNQAYLPPPCDWHFYKNAEGGDVTQVRVDLATCRAPQSLCWRPVALFDNEGSGSVNGNAFKLYLNNAGPATGTTDKFKEPTKENSGIEALNPANGQRVALVRGGAAMTDRTYGQFCGNASGPTGTTSDDKGPFFSRNFGRWRIDQDIGDDDWTGRGVYFIVDNEGNSAARAFTVEAELGDDEDDKLKVGFIVEGPTQFDSGEDRYACCPTCDCSDHSGSPASISNWGYSSGYFLFAGGPCAFRDPIENLSGDITCEAVGINHQGGRHAERTYADVIATGDCQVWGATNCSLSAANMISLYGDAYPVWCVSAVIAGISADDMGICVATDVMGHSSSDLNSTGPWVGHFWAKTDIQILGRFSLGVRPPGEANAASPFFPVPPVAPTLPWPEPLHPDWPAIYAEDDLGIVRNATIAGKIQTGSAMAVGSNNRIVGRVVGKGSIRFGDPTNTSGGRNEVVWDGSGTSTTAISDSVFYQDLGW